MDQEQKQKPSENRNGRNYFWFFLIIATTMFVVVFFVFQQMAYRMDFSDFQALVEATNYRENISTENEEESTGEIVIRNRDDQKKFDRVSGLSELTIGTRTISGKVYVSSSSDRLLDDRGKMNWTDPRQLVFLVYSLPNDEIIYRLKQELEARKIPHGFESGPGFWDRYGPLILITGVILLVFFFMLRRLGGATGPMQFGRSRGKLYAEEDLGLTFADAAGIEEAVEEVREVADFLKSAEKYQKLGGRIPRGVLLVGPPGTGKTLLAKAIAGEAGVPFFSLSGSDFVEMFVGVGAARVRDMFQQAESKAPCIIFIDELDALGKSRGNNNMGGHDEREQTLNALLVEMDGFATNSGVIVIGATNRPETLDAALMRPGRFDRHVLVDRPDLNGRFDILKVHVKHVKLGPNVDLRHIASITPGFVGADLANLVNEAALLAARNDKSTVDMEEFNEGVERVTAGLEKKQRIMDNEEKQRVAYHEAGHALVAHSLPNTDPVHKVSIIPRGLAALGYTMQRPTGERFLMTQSELESQINVLLAGTLAEEMIYRDVSTGAQNDLQRATDIARAMVTEYGMSRLGRVHYSTTRRSAFLAGAMDDVGERRFSEKTAREIDDEIKRIIDESIEKVRHILDVRKEALTALTNRLIEVESIDSDELSRIVDENCKGPVVVPGTYERTKTEKRPAEPAKRPTDSERTAQ